jgi:DNA repair exonuclease SbcCD ATPase subunit
LRQQIDDLNKLKEEFGQEELAFKARERTIADLQNDLETREQELKERAHDIEKYEQFKKDIIKDLTKKINEKILEEPQLEEMEEKINEYRLKMAKVNEAYWLLQNLMEEIKRLVC